MGEKYENLRKLSDGLIKENETIKKENQDQHAQIKVIKQELKNEKKARNDSDQYMRISTEEGRKLDRSGHKTGNGHESTDIKW